MDPNGRNWRSPLGRPVCPFPGNYPLRGRCPCRWPCGGGETPRRDLVETSQSIRDTLFSICSFFKGLFGNSTRRIQFNISSPSGWERTPDTDFQCLTKFVTRLSLLRFWPKCNLRPDDPAKQMLSLAAGYWDPSSAFHTETGWTTHGSWAHPACWASQSRTSMALSCKEFL